MTRSLLDSSIEIEFLVSDESPYFSHYTCEIVKVICDVIKQNQSEVGNIDVEI